MAFCAVLLGLNEWYWTGFSFCYQKGTQHHHLYDAVLEGRTVEADEGQRGEAGVLETGKSSSSEEWSTSPIKSERGPGQSKGQWQLQGMQWWAVGHSRGVRHVSSSLLWGHNSTIMQSSVATKKCIWDCTGKNEWWSDSV